jgi:hypothetical protein
MVSDLITSLFIHRVKSSCNFFRQRTLLNRIYIALQLLGARGTDYQAVAVFLVENAVMSRPSEGCSMSSNVMLDENFNGLINSSKN